ncbi:hypothetical protein [Halalkalibacter akibai]|uniref:Bacterial Pleckstrin homology domain-containing protein n=1 Tax=Halalkalibacter akibai (strain ATCC 43226 / DSM 21942 / CIP 109018 / JCM 9157 / 1139) TaxID=1236973 RepID=W4QSI5_HALA3|nr:hypothetical protein [Halalkalibacter akibai]GAE35080.1 hypothetical protein JCM9157_2173 [Halalkalibacter akibai JCM 9157]
MNLLASQTCVEIRQEIGWTEKRIVETKFDIHLFENQLTVKDDVFPLTSIFDISYRKKPETDAMGFLYIHTDKGVRTFYIKEDAYSLVSAYRKLKSDRPELR